MTPRALLAVLLVLDAVCWGLLIWGLNAGHFHLPVLANALMFAAMAVAVPILLSWRIARPNSEPAPMCRECGSIVGLDDRRAGFCLHCGLMQPVRNRPPGGSIGRAS
jgi:hypothetical protein